MGLTPSLSLSPACHKLAGSSLFSLASRRSQSQCLPMITAENAKELSAKANQTRWDNWRAQRSLPAIDSNPTPLPENPTTDSYTASRLARVRAQLDLIDERIREELAKGNKADGQRLNWLAQSQARLDEQERKLSGRSNPPTLRGGSKAPAKKLPNAAPPRSSPPAPATEPASDQPSDPGDEPTAASVV